MRNVRRVGVGRGRRKRRPVSWRAVALRGGLHGHPGGFVCLGGGQPGREAAEVLNDGDAGQPVGLVAAQRVLPASRGAVSIEVAAGWPETVLEIPSAQRRLDALLGVPARAAALTRVLAALT